MSTAETIRRELGGSSFVFATDKTGQIEWLEEDRDAGTFTIKFTCGGTFARFASPREVIILNDDPDLPFKDSPFAGSNGYADTLALFDKWEAREEYVAKWYKAYFPEEKSDEGA